MARIVVTGASGFVGRAAARAARDAGHEVIALGRREGVDLGPGVTYHARDLGQGGDLAPLLQGADAVIHAAGAMAGDDAAHARDTLAPTQAVLAALPEGARLVLVSSLSVYGYAALPTGVMLNELTPREIDGAKRDAYTRAKLAQERMAVAAARARGLDLWLIRPGAIYGPGRVQTGWLGISIKGRHVSPSGDPTIPGVDIARVGQGLLSAAIGSRPQDRDVSGPGCAPAVVINLIDPDPPRQSAWAEAVGVSLTRVPGGLMFKTAAALDLAGDLLPGVGRRLPRIVMAPALAARFKDLRYATTRAEDVLGLPVEDTPFAARMAAYAEAAP
jgi:nucleoside-diphosphate-sugar epimerase